MPRLNKKPALSSQEQPRSIREPHQDMSLHDAIIDSSQDAISAITLDGIITTWNPAAERLYGYAAKDAIGQPIGIIIPEERWNQARNTIEQLRRGERIEPFNATHKTKDGRLVHIRLTVSPILDRHGAIVGASAIASDNTERVRTEELLNLSEARLNAIVGAAMDAMVTINDRMRIVVFNAAAEKMFLCAADEALGRRIDRFIPERFRRIHTEHIAKFAKTGVTSRTMNNLGEVFGLRADGTEFPIEATISHVHACGQDLFTAILRDISERKRGEELRDELHAKVVHQEKLAAVGLLASGVAHEIGNPLASIQAICDNQLRKPLEPALSEKLKRVKDQVERISKIVRQLVNFARRDSEAWRVVSINDEIDSALTVAKLSRSAQRTEVRLELDPHLPLTWAMGGQLSQVFLNLFVNAFDAMEAVGGNGGQGGELTVRSAVATDQAIRISIEDQGEGISEENHKNLFVPFFTTKGIGKGTGLGLHISQGIIKRHGGEIHVRSAPGKGTTFTVEIPLRTQAPNKEQPNSAG